MTDPRTSYDRAAAGYDKDFENHLAHVIITAITEASRVSDANAVVLRTGETASALVSTLATVLAMWPSATRSPTAIRNTVDELSKRLRRRLALAEADPVLQEFMRRSFNGTDGGHA
jgi:hypothetical protein